MGVEVSKLIAIEIASKSEAKRVHEAIENRVDEGILSVGEASLVYKTDRGHLRQHYYGMTGFGLGASVGGGLGLGLGVAGAMGLINPLLGIGLLPGMFAGGYVGHFFTKHFAGKEFLKDLGAGLDAGHGYVLVATDDAGAELLEKDSSTQGHRLAVVDVTPEFVTDLAKVHKEAGANEVSVPS